MAEKHFGIGLLQSVSEPSMMELNPLASLRNKESYIFLILDYNSSEKGKKKKTPTVRATRSVRGTVLHFQASRGSNWCSAAYSSKNFRQRVISRQSGLPLCAPSKKKLIFVNVSPPPPPKGAIFTFSLLKYSCPIDIRVGYSQGRRQSSKKVTYGLRALKRICQRQIRVLLFITLTALMVAVGIVFHFSGS